jgi:hypothetical protein
MALAHFQRTFTDASGNVKPGLSVTVRRESDNGLAALFADAGSVTPKSNPFNTDANGYGSFYVTDGRYRIQATDIDWRNEDLISQPSPNFASMPQVGGDPIVESGSNADGEWTRWSDGTQIASTSNFAFSSVTSSAEWGDSWTFPIAFLAQPKVTPPVLPTNSAEWGNTNSRDIISFCGYANPISTTRAPLRVWAGGSSANGAISSVQVTAIGRWK